MRLSRLAAAAIPVVLSGTVATSTAGAAGVAAGPAANVVHLTVKPAPYFKVGSVGVINDWCGWGPPRTYSIATATLAFSATSPYGIDHYEATDYDPGDFISTVAPKITFPAWNYTGDCGGLDYNPIGWIITAFDKAGNQTTVTEQYWLGVTRWDNTFQGQPANGIWTYSSGWARSTCTCADGQSQTFSTTSGAWASYAETSTSGEHLGLMIAKGPTRGKFQVFLDGKLSKTIDSRASTNINRVYAWDSGPLAAGTHAVKIVNLATAGRSRIDINAMGSLQGQIVPNFTPGMGDATVNAAR